jgi:hypothetical protein
VSRPTVDSRSLRKISWQAKAPAPPEFRSLTVAALIGVQAN